MIELVSGTNQLIIKTTHKGLGPWKILPLKTTSGTQHGHDQRRPDGYTHPQLAARCQAQAAFWLSLQMEAGIRLGILIWHGKYFSNSPGFFHRDENR